MATNPSPAADQAPSPGVEAVNTDRIPGHAIVPFPLAADVAGRPWVDPRRMASIAGDEEMMAAIADRLARTKHEVIADDQFQSDVFWLILILGAVPAVCLAVIACIKVLG